MVCAVAISAFNFSEIVTEAGVGFQLANDDLRLDTPHGRYRGQFYAGNFEDDVAPVKLLSVGSQCRKSRV